NCGNASKAPAEIAGKKIRCKQCQTVFVAEASAPKAAAAPAAKAVSVKPVGKPAAAAKAMPKTDEDEYSIAKNPYVMREENLAAGCPFCAFPLDPPDSRICLNCGYDMQKRKRHDSRQTYEHTFADYLVYHLPTIFCFFTICIVIVIDVLSIIFAEPIMEGSWFEEDPGKYLIKPGIIPVYVILLTGIFIVTPCVYKIYKRLRNFTPPEVIKRDTND